MAAEADLQGRTAIGTPGTLVDVTPHERYLRGLVGSWTADRSPLHRGLRCYLTADAGSGLVVQDVEDDVVVSFVATRPSDRGRGSATRLVRAALVDARDRGVVAAVLQATPLAERLYQRVGFVPVGTWQEWLPA